MNSPPRHIEVLPWAVLVLVMLAGAAWAGWVFGTDSQIAQAAQRAQRALISYEQALDAERARTAAAQHIAATATRRADFAQRRWRSAQAELRQMRATLANIDTPTGEPMFTADAASP